MKRLIVCLLLAVFGTTVHAQSVLITLNYVVTVIDCREDGVISCDGAKYIGVSRKSGNAMTLKGKTLHTMAADGVTPNRFLGHEFRSGNTVYRVYEVDATLEVKQGSKVLVNEKGKWVD
jgi:hypothetical protein